MANSIGKMDRRITLQTATTTRGELGGHAESWATLATVWASIRDLKGREVFNAQQAGSTVSKIVTIRYRSGISADLRVLLPDGRTARIGHVIEIDNKQWIELYCEVING